MVVNLKCIRVPIFQAGIEKSYQKLGLWMGSHTGRKFLKHPDSTGSWSGGLLGMLWASTKAQDGIMNNRCLRRVFWH